jgi:hypothetical protein
LSVELSAEERATLDIASDQNMAVFWIRESNDLEWAKYADKLNIIDKVLEEKLSSGEVQV